MDDTYENIEEYNQKKKKKKEKEKGKYWLYLMIW